MLMHNFNSNTLLINIIKVTMKKWIKYFLSAGLIIVMAGGIYVLAKTSYNGNNTIVLLNSGAGYTSFEDVIKRPEFSNKVVYVDVWGTTCPPCFEELKNHTPQLTQRYENAKDIAFLYICIDEHPLPAFRWKDRIQLLTPKGYHVLVKGGKEEHKLAIDIIGQAAHGQYFPYIPCYFIVNKKGQIVNRPTSDPEKGELRPSDKNLLYHKLDSLRNI